mmetsp:Transcript_20351/g.51723  ORF Transcript_20351/g.51723 Transcript_20351/m.51723 type:complete len:233 (-) Transcript_20351:136-834(-)
MHYIFARAPGGPHAVPAAGWLEQALPREVVVSLLWHHVAHRVLVLLVDLRDKFLLARLRLQRLVQCVGIVDHSDAVKPFAVRDSQTAHGVCVARLLKVALELTRAPVGQPAADFALVLEVEPVQFVEPVGDGLPVPAQGEVLRVVDRSRVVFVLHLHLVALAILLISVRGEQIRLNLFKGAGSHLKKKRKEKSFSFGQLRRSRAKRRAYSRLRGSASWKSIYTRWIKFASIT